MAKARRSVQRPTKKSEYTLQHADRSCEAGWTDLCASQRNSCAELFDRLTADPSRVDNPDRQHRLKGTLSRATVVLTNVATAHPNQTK